MTLLGDHHEHVNQDSKSGDRKESIKANYNGRVRQDSRAQLDIVFEGKGEMVGNYLLSGLAI